MRNKKNSQIPVEALTQAKSIVKNFELFTTGIRVIQLIQRKSDGGGANNTKVKRIVTRDPIEFKEALAELIVLKKQSPDMLRIYSSVNSRNFKKAVRYFKQQQLDADYGGPEVLENLYFNIFNKFVSSLMKPSNKIESQFLFDLDQNNNDDALIQLSNLDIPVIKMYPTKQGWHIITKPFNPELFESENCSIHKDGLLLLDY